MGWGCLNKWPMISIYQEFVVMDGDRKIVLMMKLKLEAGTLQIAARNDGWR